MAATVPWRPVRIRASDVASATAGRLVGPVHQEADDEELHDWTHASVSGVRRESAPRLTPLTLMLVPSTEVSSKTGIS